MESIVVTITNWHKHNPRKDLKRPTWFALSNDFLDDEKLADLEPLEFHAFIYIMCQASRRCSATVEIFFAHAERRGINRELLLGVIKKLQSKSMVAVDVQIPNVDVREPTDNVEKSTATLHYITDTTLQTDTAVVKPRARKQSQLFECKTAEELWDAIDPETKSEWSKLYPEEPYIRRKLLQAWGYYREQPRKRPTTLSGWRRVLRSFLEKDWGRHMAQTPAQAVSGNPFSRIVAE